MQSEHYPGRSDQRRERHYDDKHGRLVSPVEDCQAYGVQRMPGWKALAVERRRSAYDFAVGDEGPLAHQSLLEELVQRDTGKRRRQRLHDKKHGAHLLLRGDQQAEHNPGRVIPEPRNNAEEAPHYFPAAQRVDPQTQVQFQMIQIVNQCSSLLRETPVGVCAENATYTLPFYDVFVMTSVAL